MVASANHGKSRNDTNNSRSSSSSQRPFGEMLVTSTAKVRFPSVADLIGVLPSKAQRRGQALLGQSPVLRDLDARVQPELGLPGGVLHVHMRPSLLAGEEVEAVPLHPDDGRAHGLRYCPRKTFAGGLVMRDNWVPRRGRRGVSVR